MSTVSLHRHDLIVQSEGNMVSDMDGEKVMLSVKSGKYYNLGAVGGDIWELLAEPKTVDQLVDALLAAYEVERETCEQQVMSFLELLHKEQMIQVKASGQPDPL